MRWLGADCLTPHRESDDRSQSNTMISESLSVGISGASLYPDEGATSSMACDVEINLQY